MPTDQPKPDLLTAWEVAKLLRVTTNTVHTMRKDGRLSAIELGRVYRFRRTDIEQLLTRGAA